MLQGSRQRRSARRCFRHRHARDLQAGAHSRGLAQQATQPAALLQHRPQHRAAAPAPRSGAAGRSSRKRQRRYELRCVPIGRITRSMYDIGWWLVGTGRDWDWALGRGLGLGSSPLAEAARSSPAERPGLQRTLGAARLLRLERRQCRSPRGRIAARQRSLRREEHRVHSAALAGAALAQLDHPPLL